MPYTRAADPLRAIFRALALLTLLTITASGWCKVIYVNKNAPGTVHDGASWATAFTTVQAGISASAEYDEVWVAEGTYYEYVHFNNSPLALYGGFAGTESTRADRDWNSHRTILDSGGDRTKALGIHKGSLVDGFTIRNGRGIQASFGPGNIANCVITGNEYGIYTLVGSFSVSNCTLTGNDYGVFAQSGPQTITNCTIIGNTVGVYVCPTYSLTITNSIVALNGTGVEIEDSSASVAVAFSDTYGNTKANFGNMPDPTGANGDISVDPLFVDSAASNYHIRPNSPCRNAGDDSAVPAGATDIDGQPRVIGPHVDIGSDELYEVGGIVHPATWYVSEAGDDANDGTTWLKAKRSVAAALSASIPSDEVWVAQGTYTGTIQIPQRVALYGGFAGTETRLSQRDPTAYITLLDGNSSSNPVVRAYAGGATIDGFTIRNADAGIDVGASATIANCNISGKAYGVYAYQCPLIVSHCTITNSPVGVYATGATATISDSSVLGSATYGIQVDGGSAAISTSTVSANGKGVYVNGGTGAVDACKIADNLAEGVYVIGNTTLSNCAIIGNSTRGILVDGGFTASITNCTISGNGTIGVCIFRGSAPTTNSIVAFNGTGFLRFDSTGSEALSHNDVYGNALGNFSNVPDPGAANGNLSSDPLFTKRFAGDYHLLSDSPCVDTGLDSAVTPGETDLDGKVRISGAHADMGAYEFRPPGYTAGDAAKALRFAAGLEGAPADVSRWNVDSSAPGIDLRDAVRIARKAAGLEPNP